jgi:hypothetical protein
VIDWQKTNFRCYRKNEKCGYPGRLDMQTDKNGRKTSFRVEWNIRTDSMTITYSDLDRCQEACLQTGGDKTKCLKLPKVRLRMLYVGLREGDFQKMFDQVAAVLI